MPSTTDFSDVCEGTLAAAITAAATSATVTAKTINGSAVTWPTGAHRVMFIKKSRAGTYVEKADVTSASQSGSTVTLTIASRGLSLTDGTAFGAGTGRAWAAGSKVLVSWDTHAAEQTMFKDTVNTITGSGAVRGSSTTVPLVRLNNVTTAQRDAMTASNGDMVYNTTTGRVNQYEGGAWGAAGSTTVDDGSTTVAGKFEEATVAEQGTASATGATGARLVPAVANLVKTSSGAGDENKIAVLDASGDFAAGFIPSINLTSGVTGTLPVANGGTGLTSGTSGGILGYTASGTIASSAALTSNGVVLGAGAGATPTATTAGSANQPLRVPSAGGAPAFGSSDISQSAAVTGILAAANGGTANGFTAFSGPASTTKTFTLPNASATVLTDNAAVTVAQGGTGATTLTANGILQGNGTSAVTAIAAGANNTFLKSNGTTASFAALTDTVRCVYASGTSSSAVSNPTSNTAFDTHTYAIAANDLVAGIVYEFECALNVTWVTGQVIPSVMLGSTVFAAPGVTPTTATSGLFKGYIVGTAAAGASVEVRSTAHFCYASLPGLAAGIYLAANVATNGSLTLQFGVRMPTSDAGHSVTMTMARITKMSTSAF